MPMMLELKPAKREGSSLIISIAGATSSGKTYSALLLAMGLARGGKIAAIDTEVADDGSHGRMLTYADSFDFLHLPFPPPHSPARYVAHINECLKVKPAVIIIDSGSHAWEGIGGLLDIVEDEKRGQDSRTPIAWAKARPEMHKLVERIKTAKVHVIVCLRAKEKTAVVRAVDPRDGKEKTQFVPRGWQPIVDTKELIWEFDASIMLQPEQGQGIITLDRASKGKICEPLKNVLIEGRQITKEMGEQLAAWAAGTNAPPPHVPAEPAPVAQAATGQRAKTRAERARDRFMADLAACKNLTDAAEIDVKLGESTEVLGDLYQECSRAMQAKVDSLKAEPAELAQDAARRIGDDGAQGEMM